MWLKETDGKVAKFPYSKKDLQEDFPNTSFPASLTPDVLIHFGVHEVIVSPSIPLFDEDTQYISLGEPTKNSNGTYVRSYEVLDLSKEAVKERRKALEKKYKERTKNKLDEVYQEIFLTYTMKGKQVPSEWLDYVDKIKANKEPSSKTATWPEKPNV